MLQAPKWHQVFKGFAAARGAVYSPETVSARGDVLKQDQQLRLVPPGGPRHGTVLAFRSAAAGCINKAASFFVTSRCTFTLV